ncbi:MAG: hypothetical protein HXX08_22405 [Chloroflexi bacterium]|uniref:Uncharacterized protein n=1 Tax=Candidatus Chlorohelix allophototropha TaxID=3003348 RepID=A0A8T7M997_9CHLR|nr:hypothetical protein [Chloroflexota bacterium]WJW68551.1 hypothetical protein OZ401_004165 [Chloroflexota bacterium L227-S17]
MKRKYTNTELWLLWGISFGMGSSVVVFALTSSTGSWALTGLGAMLGLIIGTFKDRSKSPRP